MVNKNLSCSKTQDEKGTLVADGIKSQFMSQQLICSYNTSYCPYNGDPKLSYMCYLPYQAVTVSYKPNTTMFDCQERLGQGYYIVVNSIQVGPSPARPGGDPNSGGGPGCSWDQSQDSFYNVIASYSNGFPRAIEARTWWQAHSGWAFVSCNRDHAAGWVKSIQCTNDTSTFARN